VDTNTSTPPRASSPLTHASLASPIVSYTIEVTLDAEAKTLTAHEVVAYANTAADPVPDLVFHLYLKGMGENSLVPCV
jgi:hypothetical protein